MSAEISDDELRDMAEHRQLKLVKSRRRKPGTGDFGKYGLKDAKGEPLLGIGKDGLTASADDIAQYLRSSALGTWKQSADTTPARQRSARESAKPAPPRAKTPKRAPTPPSRKRADRERPTPKPAPKPEPAPKPSPEPVLKVRDAKPADAAALAKLLGQLSGTSIEPDVILANLTLARKAKGGLVVADYGGIVGCCGWAVIPSIHHGLIGRLTVVIVDKGHRRRGFATAMLTVAEQALSKAGCQQIEAMSDVMINNDHGFFRARDFQQTSYRFAREIDG